MDFAEGVTYRLAFGLASRLAESDRVNFPGRLRSNAAAGGGFDRILAEVLRQITVEGEAVDMVKEGVEDALTGRRPQW